MRTQWLGRENLKDYFLCYHLFNLASFNFIFPASGTGTLASGQIFFPVSQALILCYGAWIANIARDCLNTNKISHSLNVRVQFTSWNLERRARGLGSMPGSSTEIQGDLGRKWLTLFCPVTLRGIANTSLKFVGSLKIFDKWLYGVAWNSSSILAHLSIWARESLWEKIVNEGC